MSNGDLEPLATCERCQARRGYIVKRPDGRVLCQGCWQEFALNTIEQALERTRPRPEAPSGSHYHFLGIPLDATEAEIEEALARKVADLDQGFDRETMQRLQKAETVLGDSKRKEQYDRELRQQLAQQAISPIEDFRGARVVSIADLVTFCDGSEANWKQAQRLLADDPDFFAFWLRDQDKALTANIRTLLDAVRAEQKAHQGQDSDGGSSYQFALDARGPEWLRTRHNAGSSPRPTPTTQSDDVSGVFFRHLNQFLYTLYPDRPYRLFQAIDRYDQPSFKRRLATPADLPAFVDVSREHWTLVRQHLYQGLLPQWLVDSYSWRYREGNHRNRAIMNMRRFLDQVCLPLRGEQEDLGLEMLVEFIDRSVPHPRIQLTINGQVNGFEGKSIDPEDETMFLSLQAKNVTRGYFESAITSSFKSPLSAKLEMTSYGISHPNYNRDSSDHLTLHNTELKTMSLRIQHLDMLNFGSTAHGEVSVRQTFPEGSELILTCPVTLHMAEYRSGKRLPLIEKGLRGGCQGFTLHTITALLLAIMALAFAAALDSQYAYAWPEILQASLPGVCALTGVALLFGAEGALLALGKGYSNFPAATDASTHTFVSIFIIVVLVALGVLFPQYPTLSQAMNGFLAAVVGISTAWVINIQRQRRYRASGTVSGK